MVRTIKSRNLVTRTTRGFFGLNELHKFFHEDIDPLFHTDSNCEIILDFSKVIYWDISALLWLVIALNYYRDTSIVENKGIFFKLRLPNETESQNEELIKSADYLRRWQFGTALSNISDDPNELLVESQKGYFDCEPKYYYPRRVIGPSGLEEQLISKGLVEIRNLVDLEMPRSTRYVSKACIDSHIKRFIVNAVGDILYNQCNIDKDTADMFVTHLLHEALANVLR